MKKYEIPQGYTLYDGHQPIGVTATPMVMVNEETGELEVIEGWLITPESACRHEMEPIPSSEYDAKYSGSMRRAKGVLEREYPDHTVECSFDESSQARYFEIKLKNLVHEISFEDPTNAP